jgi:transcriptional regulator with XRE-family HTH domain
MAKVWGTKSKEVTPMVLMRHEIGDVLRDFRLQKGKTLRDVAGRANVALGYLSEIERGQKEASSEVLQSIADALDEPLSQVLIEVGERLSVFEELTPVPTVPDTLPEEFYRDLDDHLAAAKRS